MTIQFPEKFIKRYQMIIPNFEQFLEILRVPVTPSLRINTLKGPKAEILAMLGSLELVPIPWYPDGYYVKNRINLGSLASHQQGLIYLQEAISMLPPIILAPRPNEKILDLAAAPGSKTTQLAMLMGNQGLIVANDISKNRLRALISNLKRLGVINTVVTNYPGQILGTILPNYFDKVLLDAPCSLEGTIRNSPEVLKNWTETKIKRLSQRQEALINSAFRTLKPNGILIYTTCTFAPEENEAVVSYLLKKYPEIAVCEPISLSGIKYHSGVNQWQNEVYPEAVKNCLRIYPHDNDTEGFFIAKIRKVLPTPEYHQTVTYPKTRPRSYDRCMQELLNTLITNYNISPRFFREYPLELKKDTLYLMTKEVKDFQKLKVIYCGYSWAKYSNNKILVSEDSLRMLNRLMFNGENA
ncbi:MAG: RsmB/NOP family class I SAM-dependent RNA methyltransferase [candidate division WOR-3 bacterium]